MWTYKIDANSRDALIFERVILHNKRGKIRCAFLLVSLASLSNLIKVPRDKH